VTNPDDKLAEYLAPYTTMLHRKRKLRLDLRRKLEIGGVDPAPVVGELQAYLDERPFLRVIATFSPLKGEIDLLPLLRRSDRTWVFPKVEGAELGFYHVKNPLEDLVPGAFNILEPREGLERYPAERIDLFLCPGLGFDTHGGRIGRGMGFYDRVLERARPDAVKLGVCFGFQLVDEVDMEDHDIRMNGVIAG
jgi:5-formyltetrahydrofolate cyclo-ligase